jgi:hypothetical protein
MSPNRLRNPDFEEGSWDVNFTGVAVNEINPPKEWIAWWKKGGLPIPWDPQNPVGYETVEMLVIHKEMPFIDPPRIHYGEYSVKMFTQWAIHLAGLYQRIVGVEIGDWCEFWGWAHAWSTNEDYPYESDQEDLEDIANFTFQVGIDPFGGTDPFSDQIMWGEGRNIYDAFGAIASIKVQAQANEITVFVRSSVRWRFKHCDAYLDNFHLSIEPPEPEPIACRGAPRTQYERTYILFPTGSSLEWQQQIKADNFDKKWTYGESADDAGLGDLDVRIVHVMYEYHEDWDKVKLDDFFHDDYPGVIVNHNFDYVKDDPQPGQPPEPIIHYSQNYGGLQHYQTARDWDVYVAEAHPIATKFFFCADAVRGKEIEPRMLTIWRKFIGAGTTGRMLDGNRRETSLELLDEYSAEMQTVSNMTGLSMPYIVERVDRIESLNETIPSWNVPQIEKAVEFDWHFGNHVYERYGKEIQSALLNVAIGNPAKHEVELLLPCAILSHEGKATLGYHGYWASNKDQDYMDSLWIHHAGRAMEGWDPFFTALGIYPTYFLGENGIVFSPDGSWLDPYSGWKQCGDFPNYIAQIERFNAKIAAWNQTHQGRCYGGTIFIYGHSGWPNYDFGHGDLLLLMEAMRKYA